MRYKDSACYVNMTMEWSFRFVSYSTHRLLIFVSLVGERLCDVGQKHSGII